MDPFDVLGLPASFSLMPEQIGRAYLARAAAVHPDLDEGSDDDSSTDSRTSDAELLNRARAMLLDPELRGAALLKRFGGPGPDDRSLPVGFLPEMMDLREQVETEVEKEGESARVRWRAWAAQRREVHVARTSELFGRAAAGGTALADVLREIRVELNAWRYIERMIEQLTPGYSAGDGR